MASYRFYPVGVGMQNLQTIFTEAVEIAFVMCNRYSNEYSVAKIVDLVQQIIPSAYVYGTAYWMFFRRDYKGTLCVCRNFELFCSHRRPDNKEHLDMSPLRNVSFHHVINRRGGYFGMPVNFSVEISMQYNINLLEVTISFMLENFSYQEIIKVCHGISPLYVIRLRYLITPEKRPNNSSNTTSTIVNHPSASEFYGTVFPSLMQRHLYQIPGRYMEYFPGVYLPSSAKCPQHTLLPFEYNIEFAPSPAAYSTVLNHATAGFFRRATCDKATQTEGRAEGRWYINVSNAGVYVLDPAEGKCLMVNGMKIEVWKVRNEISISQTGAGAQAETANSYAAALKRN